jgi:5'(3')-deoxyribonucleotidase
MPYVYLELYKLSQQFEIIPCSIGTYENVSQSALWIKKNLPFIDNAVFIVNKDCHPDKSLVDMSGAIFADDVAANLESSNAEVKILFDNDFEWNVGKNFDFKTYNWLEASGYINSLE